MPSRHIEQRGSLAGIFGLILGGVLYTTLGTDTLLAAGVIFGLVFVLSIQLRDRFSRA